MVKEEFGFIQPEFVSAEGEERTYADLIAASEKDMLLWLKEAVFDKKGKTEFQRLEKGSLSNINDRSVLVVREPKTGIRRACYVETPKFLNDAHDYLVVTGSGRMRK